MPPWAVGAAGALMRSRRSAARQSGLQSCRRAAPNALARSLVPTPNRLQVGRLTMSATTIHFGMLFGDYFLRAGALDSRCIFRLTVRVLKGARDNKPVEKLCRQEGCVAEACTLQKPRKARSRARAPQPGAKYRPLAYACSPVIPIHMDADLKCEMARAARGDQGLLPVVRLELRTLMCGALRAAAAQTSAVVCWWDTPWAPLPELADGARHGAVWVVGSGPGDVGPSSLGVMTCLRAAFQPCQSVK